MSPNMTRRQVFAAGLALIASVPSAQTIANLPYPAGYKPNFAFQVGERAIQVSPEDFIAVITRQSVANQVLTLTFRLRTRDGTIVIQERTWTPASDRSSVTQYFQLSEGYLIGLEILFKIGGKVGQNFTTAFLTRAPGDLTSSNYVFCQGYLAVGTQLFWPNNTSMNSSVAGPGFLYNPTIAAPSAGVELSITVPTGTRWKIRSLVVLFTTTATAGTRNPGLIEVTDASGNVIFYTGPGTPPSFTTTGTTNVVQWLPGWPLAETVYDGGGRIRLTFMNDFVLPAGFIIKTVGSTFIGTDGYGVPQLLVEEWIEP